jgi:hypothetical protein
MAGDHGRQGAVYGTSMREFEGEKSYTSNKFRIVVEE